MGNSKACVLPSSSVPEVVVPSVVPNLPPTRHKKKEISARFRLLAGPQGAMEDFDFDLDNLDLPEFPVENFFDEYVAVLQQGQQPQLGASGTSSGATGDSGREGSPVVMPLHYPDQRGSPQAATCAMLAPCFLYCQRVSAIHWSFGVL